MTDGTTPRRHDATLGERTLVLLLVQLGVVASSYRLSAQCPDGSAPPCRAQASRAMPASNSVAVLYFDNLSGDSGYAYFADGLTEELIAKLGDVPRLHVRSRFSVRRYKERAVADPVAVGHTLSVAFLVTGSVRPGPGRVRVTVELIRAATGTRVWGRVLDHPGEDPLAVTAEIADDVAAGVIGELLPEERRALMRRPTSSLRAYDHVLRGNYHLAQRTPPGGLKAIQQYQEAGRLDPTFTAAFARLALAYRLAQINAWDVGLPRDSLETLARGALARAQALDSLNTDVLLASAVSVESELAALQRAVARDSDNAELQHFYGLRLAIAGDRDAATVALRRAIEIDPDRPITLGWLSLLAAAEGRFAEARRWVDSALTLNPNFPGYAHRAVIDLHLGDTAQAKADAAASRRGAGAGVGEAITALVAAVTGDTAAGRAGLEHLLGDDRGDSLLNDEARAYAAAGLATLGDTLTALDLLEQPRPNRYVRLLARSSVFAPLRSDPRFRLLVEESRPR